MRLVAVAADDICLTRHLIPILLHASADTLKRLCVKPIPRQAIVRLGASPVSPTGQRQGFPRSLIHPREREPRYRPRQRAPWPDRRFAAALPALCVADAARSADRDVAALLAVRVERGAGGGWRAVGLVPVAGAGRFRD